MYELYKIDPDGTLIYKNLIQQLGNKALRKQFMSILDQFQKGAKLIGASENETEDVTITSTGSVVTERAEQLLDAAPKRPVELKPQGRVRQVPLRTSVGLRPSSLEETTTGRKPSKLLEERQNLTTIQEEHEDHQGGGYAHGELKQRQTQQPRQRQTGAGYVSKWQPAGRHLLSVLGKGLGSHDLSHSMAWDL